VHEEEVNDRQHRTRHGPPPLHPYAEKEICRSAKSKGKWVEMVIYFYTENIKALFMDDMKILHPIVINCEPNSLYYFLMIFSSSFNI